MILLAQEDPISLGSLPQGFRGLLTSEVVIDSQSEDGTLIFPDVPVGHHELIFPRMRKLESCSYPGEVVHHALLWLGHITLNP